MSRRLLLIGLLLVPASIGAQRVVSFERLVIGDAPVGLAAATREPSGVGIIACLGRLEEAPVRYRWDGGLVGATTGLLLNPSDVLHLTTGQDAAAIRFAKVGSTSGVLSINCWRP